MTTLILFINSTADFFFYFAFFSMRKQAININFADLEVFRNRHTFLIFSIFGPFPFLVTGKSIFKQGKSAADCVSARFFFILGNFAILRGRGNFSSTQAGLASFLAFFSNSATCQDMPEISTG